MTGDGSKAADSDMIDRMERGVPPSSTAEAARRQEYVRLFAMIRAYDPTEHLHRLIERSVSAAPGSDEEAEVRRQLDWLTRLMEERARIDARRAQLRRRRWLVIAAIAVAAALAGAIAYAAS